MTIKLLIFGALARELGAERVDLDVPEAATVADAVEAAAERFPALRPHLEAGRLAFALNLSYTRPSEKLSAGDELAIIPPVSGG